MSAERIDPIFGKTVFKTSVAREDQLPRDGLPQVLMAGKSNAGKSSLINKLCRQNRLARISSEAGKTRLLNFYSVADRFYLVDLPGYGFSKSSQKEREAFSRLTDRYIHSDSPIRLILHLIDARHDPSRDDLNMMTWLEHMRLPYIVLLNKSDKLSAAQRNRARQGIEKSIRAELGELPQILPISAVNGMGFEELARTILTVIGIV